jgi:hypothetical protein
VLLVLQAPTSGGNTTFPLVGEGVVEARGGGGGGGPTRAQVELLGSQNREAHRIWRRHCARCDRGLSIRPKRGRAIVFFNHVLQEEEETGGGGAVGELERLSFHGGCDVLEGGVPMLSAVACGEALHSRGLTWAGSPPPPPRAEKWIANYWVELAPKFFCANLSCADGGGPLLDGLAADWTPEAGVRLRGQLQPQPQPPPPTQSAVHGGHSGGGGDSQSQATVVNPSGGGGRPEL